MSLWQQVAARVSAEMETQGHDHLDLAAALYFPHGLKAEYEPLREGFERHAAERMAGETPFDLREIEQAAAWLRIDLGALLLGAEQLS